PKKNSKSVYILTNKGKQLLAKPKKIDRRSDGFSTLIIFDIPENKSKERFIFRRYLVRNGYTQLQKSVLISPDKFDPDTKDLIQELGIKPFVTVISGKVDYLL
ncbi:MAG: hypothetical protein V1897_16290, partial [Pseudomonadota bacterium]